MQRRDGVERLEAFLREPVDRLGERAQVARQLAAARRALLRPRLERRAGAGRIVAEDLEEGATFRRMLNVECGMRNGSPAGGAVERSETVGVERLVSGMASGEGGGEEREREVGEGGGAFGVCGRGGGGGGEEADRYAE